MPFKRSAGHFLPLCFFTVSGHEGVKFHKMSNAAHVLIGKISGGEFELTDVHCEIYLSKKVGKIGKAVFRLPADFDFKNSNWPFEFSFVGEEKRPGNQVACTIRMDKLYRRGVNTTRSHTDVQECIAKADISDLEIDYPLSQVGEKLTGHFLLSHNSLLSPRKHLQSLRTGEVEVSGSRDCFSFPLCDGSKIRFDRYYSEEHQDDGSLVLTPQLVGEFKQEITDNDFAPSYQPIDDFMMLASFAARQRSLCLGWQIESEAFIKEHYRWMVVPKNSRGASYVDGLIYPYEFESFITTTYEKFQSCEHKTLLREAIYGVFANAKDVTSNFLKLYSALETIVLIYRKENGLEYVLADFSKLQGEIKKAIKQQLPSDELKEQRKLLYNNLSGLNRVPFAEAFAVFKERFDLDFTDLWCVGCGKWSLTDIRNSLVHGNKFEEHENEALGIAAHHLKFVLERCLLAYLGWEDVNARTKVHPSVIHEHHKVFSEMRGEK